MSATYWLITSLAITASSFMAMGQDSYKKKVP
jgi:hypothetical protein